MTAARTRRRPGRRTHCPRICPDHLFAEHVAEGRNGPRRLHALVAQDPETILEAEPLSRFLSQLADAADPSRWSTVAMEDVARRPCPARSGVRGDLLPRAGRWRQAGSGCRSRAGGARRGGPPPASTSRPVGRWICCLTGRRWAGCPMAVYSPALGRSPLAVDRRPDRRSDGDHGRASEGAA